MRILRKTILFIQYHPTINRTFPTRALTDSDILTLTSRAFFTLTSRQYMQLNRAAHLKVNCCSHKAKTFRIYDFEARLGSDASRCICIWHVAGYRIAHLISGRMRGLCLFVLLFLFRILQCSFAPIRAFEIAQFAVRFSESELAVWMNVSKVCLICSL